MLPVLLFAVFDACGGELLFAVFDACVGAESEKDDRVDTRSLILEDSRLAYEFLGYEDCISIATLTST
jgi:hypothetical protein